MAVLNVTHASCTGTCCFSSLTLQMHRQVQSCLSLLSSAVCMVPIAVVAMHCVKGLLAALRLRQPLNGAVRDIADDALLKDAMLSLHATATHKTPLCFTTGTDHHQDLQLMSGMGLSALGISHLSQIDQSVSGMTVVLGLQGTFPAVQPAWGHLAAKSRTRQQSTNCRLHQIKQSVTCRSEICILFVYA